MSGKMEMSLDDIIKQNRTNKRKAGAGGKTGGAAGGKRNQGNSGKGGRPSGNRSSGGSPKRSQVRNKKPGGGVIRNRNTGGITRNRPSTGFGRSLPSYKREAFLGTSNTRRFGSSSDATKLIVSNLDFGVTDSDILELFGEFGPLKSAGVHYDRSGRSLGSADLIYERRSDAIKAMKQYNGVPLDGREMNIQLATSEIPGAKTIRNGGRLGNFKATNTRNSTSNNRGGNNKRPGQRNGPGNKGKSGAPGKRGAKPGGRQKKQPPPTAEELDAQLEEYVKSKVANSEGA